jgi:predicted RNase H-like HicB family nuclease
MEDGEGYPFSLYRRNIMKEQGALALAQNMQLERRRIRMGDYRFSVLIGRNGEGWVAFCPEFQGCVVHGKSYEKTLAKIRGEIRLRVEDSLGDCEEIPQVETVNFTMLQLSL